MPVLVTKAFRLNHLLMLFSVLVTCACQPIIVSSRAGETPKAQALQTEPPPAAAAPTPTATIMRQSEEPAHPPQPVTGGQVTIGGLEQLDSLHPLRAESDVARSLMPLVYERLLTYDPASGRLMPHLAKSWQVAPDDRTITFTLRGDARWPDGGAVTAGDVHSTIKAALDPALDSLYGARLSQVQDVTTADDRTLVVSLDTPHCPSLAWIGELPILPRLSTGAGVITDTSSTSGIPAGSGPFALNPDSSTQELHLVRNTQYWGHLPYLDALTYRAYESPDALQSALERGEVDIAWPAGDRQTVGEPLTRRTGGADLVWYPSPHYIFVAFNNQHAILKDRQARLALSLAVDRRRMLREVVAGNGTLVAGTLPADHWAADAALSPPPYDPEEARRLLAELGWHDTDGDGWLDRQGQPLRLPVRTDGGNRLREEVAAFVAASYRAIGIDSSVEVVSWAILVDDLFRHDFGAVVAGWPLTGEPDQSAMWLSSENQVGSGLNFVSFSDADTDRLLRRAVTLPGCDENGRAELYRDIQQRIAQERPYDFLFVPHAALLVRGGVLGVAPGPFGSPFWNAALWNLAPRAQQRP